MGDSSPDLSTIQGRWRVSTRRGPKILGVLQWTTGGEATLRLHGAFRQFRNFEPGGFGSPSARTVVLGIGDFGERVTLFDVFEMEHSMPLGNEEKARASYVSPLVLRNKHVRSWESFSFKALRFSLDELAACVGPTGFDEKWRRDGFVISYGAKKPLNWRIGQYTVTIHRWARGNDSARGYTLSEEASCIVRHPKRAHYLEFMYGPVHTFRMLLEFISLRRLRITEMAIAATQPGAGDCPIHFQGLATAGHEQSARRERMFTIEELGENKFGEVLANWHTARERLYPVLDLFSTLLSRDDVATELRFSTMVYLLEAFHRITCSSSGPAVHGELVRALVAQTPASLQDRVRGLLGQLDSPSLDSRLRELASGLPKPFVFIHGDEDAFLRSMGPGPDFISEVVNTRNYLTHLDKARQRKALPSSKLVLACFRLEAMLRFLLLRHIGFSSTEANGYILGTIAAAVPRSFSMLLDRTR